MTREAGGDAVPSAEAITTGLEAIRSFGSRDQLYVMSESDYESAPFATSQLLSSEESVRLVKAVERLVRGSREYKTYISYLRNDLGMTRCSFLSCVDVSGDVSMEFHHTPLTLFDICQVIMDHRLARGQGITSLSLADEVMAAHFDNIVGLVPLTVTVHKLVHSGAILVHPSQVHGRWLDFLRSFPDGVNAGHIEKVVRFVETSEADVVRTAQKLQYTPGAGIRADAALPTPEQIESFLLPGR